MPFVLKIALAALLVAQTSFAGPSDGGGTNINISEDELTDLVRFRKLYGDKQYLIDAEKFRVKGETESVHSQIKPLIDRMIYFYPTMGLSLTEAFKKPWIVVNAEFTPRNSNEKKVVAQTKEAVFVSLPWLKKANAETLKLVWVHEAFRNLAIRFGSFLVENALLRHWDHPYNQGSKLNASEENAAKVKPFLEKRAVLLAKAMDQVAEDLTPVAFAAFPVSVLDKTLDDLMSKINVEIFDSAYDAQLSGLDIVGSRRSVYLKLKLLRPGVIMFRVCDGITSQSKPSSHRDLGQIADNLTTMARNTPDFILGNSLSESGFTVGYSGIVVFDSLAAHSKTFDLINNALSGIEAMKKREPSISETLTKNILKECRDTESVKILINEFERDAGELNDPYKPVVHETLPEDAMLRVLHAI